MMTFEMLTGQTRDHVINFAGNHHLQFNATKAFLAMQ
ncbi:TPA: D-alanyl-D-alanine carboxypeptidase family protein, partial [Morganella morganii]|nr:D-alanyl-D-alanine carboxypeptidase family protein [Morganella morganii]